MPQACDSVAIHSTCVAGIRDYSVAEMKIRTKLSLGSRLQEVCGRAAMPHLADALVCGLSIIFSLKACYISLSVPECIFEREKENLATQAGHCHPHPFFLQSLGKQ